MISQVFIVCIISLASASPVYQSPVYKIPAEPIYQSKLQLYTFGFDVRDEYGTSLKREELGDELGSKKGSYSYTDPYGIFRQVDYIADNKGFRAAIKTNEPGTENQNPADVEIQSNAEQYHNSPVSAYGKTSLSSQSVPSARAYPQLTLSSPYRQQASAVYGVPLVNKNLTPSSSLSKRVQPIGPIFTAPGKLSIVPNTYSSVVRNLAADIY